ncbi:glycosyl transferase, UDP-glucuronosyltransferase [Beggiatoa alba B18LD]|uniref:Glycosyl transferase, UDP-glucuronosyltransferase n=1 Tax=Beggiatoa alba B18LD TaxID=395493 RepID=I3CL24_9GAMM|nr:glycosyltransferase [Beggiatoa alba]EIJ44317.1 glycosyl transferase, UDP-glucuronosyltransferase [Beggiatoa alba B18LD]
MRITVITFGTEGDTRPIIALCHGLQAKGHQVTLLVERTALNLAQSWKVRAQALSGDMLASLQAQGVLSPLMKKGGDATQLSKALAKIASENTAAWMQVLVEQAQGSDLILYSGLAAYVGLSVADYLRIPAIGLGLWPMSPTREFPSPLLPPWHLTGWLNYISHLAINGLLWRLFRKTLNQARQQVCGQAPRYKMWRDYPILYGVSPHLVPTPHDWLPVWKLCGNWQLPLSSGWQAPSALQDFLATGEPPIYVGFGSMAGFDQQRLLNIVVEATQGKRVVFLAGWSGIRAEQLPKHFFMVNNIPHDWLFPKMSLIIHHGGAGTTHAAARAGIPEIILPFAGDQFFWAGRLADLGISPEYIASQKITAESLATHIQFAQQANVQAKAKTLGLLMEQEDGIQAAIQQIETWMIKPMLLQ